jgi:PAS domain S-box-containing protein
MQPWWMGQILRGNVSLTSSVDDLPEEAVAERAYLRQRGIASAASIPLKVAGEIAGAITFMTVRDHVSWTEDLVNQLRAIGDILWNALKRRQAMQAMLSAQEVLRESEERFRLMADTAPVMIWMSGVDKRCHYVNRPWLEFTGRSLEAELRDGWLEAVHPEDRQSCIDTFSQAFDRREPFRMEYRLRRLDGEYRWLLDSGVPRFTRDGLFAGYIGSAIDVTERRLAKEALSSLSRRLMQAHEKERAVVARELHDDIGQRATALAWQLQALVRRLPSETKERALVQTMCDQAIELTKVIPAMSHRLHSAELKSFGIAVASGRLCRELSELSQVQIEFRHDGTPAYLSEDVTICLFRVLQEALINAVKHARVHHIFVSLRGTPNEIELNVIDEGVGFDSTVSNAQPGLGFVSMKERLSLIGGDVVVDSRIGAGTAVRARVPLTDGKAQPS